MPNALVDKFSKEELEEIVRESNSYKDVMEKLGYKSNNGNSYKTIQSRLKKFNISTEHFNTKKGIERTFENVFCKDSTARQSTLRRHYKDGNYSEYKCSICGLPAIWNDKPLTLTLDHINGCSNDNRLENLRWVCPNCDRQLPTYSRGVKGLERKENIKNICPKCGGYKSRESEFCQACYKENLKQNAKENKPITREELKKLIRKKTFVSIAESFGVTDNAIRKWCKTFELPYRKIDINNYTDEEWELI